MVASGKVFTGARVSVEARLSWWQIRDAIVASFEANAENPDVFCRNDAHILRHVASMVDTILDQRKQDRQ